MKSNTLNTATVSTGTMTATWSPLEQRFRDEPICPDSAAKARSAGSSRATLVAGDTLAIYTDGVTEAFNEAEEEFGEDRFADSLRRHRHLPPQGTVSAVVDEVRRFSTVEQSDDITLTIARCR